MAVQDLDLSWWWWWFDIGIGAGEERFEFLGEGIEFVVAFCKESCNYRVPLVK